MCEIIKNIEWLNLVQTIASIFVAFVAYRALETWKHQSKAQKQTDFLDELTDTVHEYIQQMTQPIEMLKMVHIGIDSHSHITNENNTNEFSGPIAYIGRRGTDDAKQLWEYINQCNHSVSKIQSLLAKGQVYDLKKYNICNESCTNLVWQHKRIQGVASIIGSQYMNWDNPKVQTALKNVLAIKPSEIESSLREQNSIYLGFVKDNYSAIY